MTFVAQAPSVAGIMLRVLAALLPAVAAYVYCFGPAVLVQIALASAAALATEAVMLRLRGLPLAPFLGDGSALVTAWLIALAFPPLVPWWLTVAATAFGIAVAKHLYGGLGNNLFNPAMVAYAAAIVSFPLQMTHWAPPLALAQTGLGFAGELAYIFGGALPAGVKPDALAMATPLDTIKTQLALQQPLAEAMAAPVFGAVAGKGGELVALGYLAGGLYLWWARIISWHVPVAFLGALALLAGIFSLVEPARHAGPLFHLAAGASLMGAFFILTDPVTGPTTPRGKLAFAAGAGALTWLIRSFGGYPDGVAFATLLMNLCVPLIDFHARPPVFGARAAPREEP